MKRPSTSIENIKSYLERKCVGGNWNKGETLDPNELIIHSTNKLHWIIQLANYGIIHGRKYSLKLDKVNELK